MYSSDAVSLVQAIVGAEMKAEHGPGADGFLPKGCTVTLSRDYAAEGESVARDLARRLGVRCFDKDLLDAVAKDAKVDAYLMRRLDEHVQSRMNDWAYTVISGKSAFREDYRRHLVNVILGISERGGVIVGRGAQYILDPKIAFRLRITATVDHAAKALATQRGITEEAAAKEIRAINAERAAFIKGLYNRDVADASAYDLVINSDRFKREDIVEMILDAMARAGFPVPAATPA